MFKRALAVLMVFAVVMAFSLPAFAQNIVKGKVEALDKDAKKVTISGMEYSLGNEAAQTEVTVGDEVEASIDDVVEDDAEGGTIIKLIKQYISHGNGLLPI